MLGWLFVKCEVCNWYISVSLGILTLHLSVHTVIILVRILSSHGGESINVTLSICYGAMLWLWCWDGCIGEQDWFYPIKQDSRFLPSSAKPQLQLCYLSVYYHSWTVHPPTRLPTCPPGEVSKQLSTTACKLEMKDDLNFLVKGSQPQFLR